MIQANVQKRLTASGGPLDLQVKLEVSRGECVALFGESGSGKTSVLRMLAGLLSPDGGEIRVNDEIWYDGQRGIHLPPQRRGLGFVFQDYALFPHLTVWQNLTFALPKGAELSLIHELAEVMELGGLMGQKPAKLSGGQQQRVALARTLGMMPPVLLLDEPLSALDQRMRRQIGAWLADFVKRAQTTILLVSHDPAEIIQLAQRVCALEAGQIVRDMPASGFFPSHVPPDVVFTATVLSLEVMGTEWLITLQTAAGVLHLRQPMADFPDLKAGDQWVFSGKRN